MKCVNPRKLKNPGATGFQDYYMQTACGKCYACLANRRRSWLFRLQNENLDSCITLFVTLTYDEFNVLKARGDPSVRLLNKKDLQDFIKRLAHFEQFKYYGIGEYGTHTLRPHYHLVLFFKTAPYDLPLDNLTFLIDKEWSKGFVSVSRATYRRLNYVLHYHTRPKEPIKGLKTFQVFSKALGIGFLNEDMIDYLVRTKSTITKDYNGNTYVIPRYYRKKLINAGYDVDPPEPKIFASDWTKEAIEKAFGKPLYKIPSIAIATYIRERKELSMKRLFKYNKQDKFN